LRRSNPEGTYHYSNECDNIFQVTISCGDVFGDDDPDLCLYSEFSRGTLLATQEPGSELLPGGDLFFLPNAAILEDGTINPDSLCVFPGTFRRLSSMVEEEDTSSIGCETTSTNLKLVVKGNDEEGG